jgi:hypothetical protein
MKYALIGLAVILAGCQANRPLAELSYSEIKLVADEIEKRCAAQGAPRGSSEWDACARQEITRENARRNRARQVADSIANSTVVCNQVGTATVCI